MRISILSSTFSGNKGATAMLKSLIENLPNSYNYNLLTVYPNEDIKQNPYKNLSITPAKPQQMIFVGFPLAITYYLLKWVQPVKLLLLKYPVLKSIYESDLVVDQAGIAFVDSRGIIMNSYNFICIAIPVLMGKKVVKFSQALGPFNSFWNRLWAKTILPKLAKVCARGDITYKHLLNLELDNVVNCSDGAFLMPDNETAKNNIEALIKNDQFYDKDVIAISLSSVVNDSCNKAGIDYKRIMSELIQFLIEEKGYGVLLIANAARKGNTKKKNNDLPLCQQIYNKVVQPESCRYYNEEFTPEEIRELIGLSKVLVASRFHAMIGALYKGVPVFLVGWSHKYQEVLNMFSLGKNAIDYRELSLTNLIKGFNCLEQEEFDIRFKIKENLNTVQKSAMRNIDVIQHALKRV